MTHPYINKKFGQLLSGMLSALANFEGKRKGHLEAEIAELMSRSAWSIQKYQQGRIPDRPVIEDFARLGVKRARLSRQWTDEFLRAASYTQTPDLLEELFPAPALPPESIPPSPYAYLTTLVPYRHMVTPYECVLTIPASYDQQHLFVGLHIPLCVLGRCPITPHVKSTMWVQDHQRRVSRTHARIDALLHDEHRWEFLLRDTQSKHGTYINGEKIQHTQPLVHDDEIGLAGDDVLLRFSLADETDD